MPIDVTNNAQYVALQQSYEDQISRDQQLIDGGTRLKDLQAKMKSLDPQSPDFLGLQVQFNSLSTAMALQDPDGSIRARLNNGSESIQKLRVQQADALDSLETVLIGKDALQQAHDAAEQATGGVANSEVDVMTRVQMTFAMLGQADEKVIGGQMDVISGNVDKITQLNSLSEAVRSARPDGTNSSDSRALSADVVKQLESLGAQMPPLQLNSDGKTYQVKQSDFDTMINNIQSTESSLTTLNQNKTIDLNKSIDVSQQCTTFESTDLEKWAQLMQKLSS